MLYLVIETFQPCFKPQKVARHVVETVRTLHAVTLFWDAVLKLQGKFHRVTVTLKSDKR